MSSRQSFISRNESDWKSRKSAEAVRQSAWSAAPEQLERRILMAATPTDQYLFDEGAGATTIADTGTPGGNTGTLVGNNPPTFVPGPSGQATDFALQFTGDGVP